MKAIIDPLAGFCGGVSRAIDLVEEALSRGEKLAVKGELIHNRPEVDRLQRLGLGLIEALEQADGRPVLVRTHGEEGEFFRKARQLGVKYVDATCPKVMRSQRIIRQAYREGKQIVVVGRLNHPEVVALQGHCDGTAIIVNKEKISRPINPERPTLLIAQTTVASETFMYWQQELLDQVKDLQIFDSRCDFVTRRQQELTEFAALHPAIIFVGGRHSSNSVLLYNTCRQTNANTFFVEDETELDPDWLQGYDHVGITGSASTPMWLLKKVAETVKALDQTEVERRNG